MNDGKEGEGEKELWSRCFCTAAKATLFTRCDKAADLWLERKNMASLSGCEEEANSREREGEEVRQQEGNRLGAQSSSCLETSGTLEQNTLRNQKPS